MGIHDLIYPLHRIVSRELRPLGDAWLPKNPATFDVALLRTTDEQPHPTKRSVVQLPPGAVIGVEKKLNDIGMASSASRIPVPHRPLVV